jgi:hypothetical protein
MPLYQKRIYWVFSNKMLRINNILTNPMFYDFATLDIKRPAASRLPDQRPGIYGEQTPPGAAGSESAGLEPV